LLLFSEKFNGAGKGSSDPPQNRRIKMLKNYKEQKDMENDGIETPKRQEKRLSTT
jgi:hypothetical protein